VERGIHAASPSEFFEPLEIPNTSHFDALKRRKRRAPGAFLNQPWGAAQGRFKNPQQPR